MPGERLERILTQFQADGGEKGASSLCEVCTRVSAMTGAGIMLMSGEMPIGSVCSSNDTSAVIEDLQFTLGEGPCIDAYHTERPVLEPDLADPVTPRWLGFTPPALAAGARAVFGFPLQSGAVRLGALNLYRDRRGPLTDEQLADALVLAGVVTRAVLGMQAQAPPGVLAAELDAGSDLRWVVHQAAGMIAAQLDVSMGEALIRLRAYAFTHDRPIAEVAESVVSRRLRFNTHSDGTG